MEEVVDIRRTPWPRNLILVGNAEGTSERGDAIDSFDGVVRFNHYRTAGFEKLIGSKVTHHVVIEGIALKDRKRILQGEPARLLSNGIRTIRNQHRTCLRNLEDFPDCDVFDASIEKTAVWMLRREMPGNTRWPSTGFVAIVRAIIDGCDITVTNFDWAKTGHYFAERHKMTPHAWMRERSVVQRMIREGRIKTLE